MSMNILMVFDGRRLPSIARIQAKLKAQDVPLKLDDVGNLSEHSGFWPMSLARKKSGFEWCYGDIAGILGDDIPKKVSRCNAGTDLAFRDEAESVCAMFVAAVIAELADGFVLDLETDEFVGPKEAMKQAGMAHKQLAKPARRPLSSAPSTEKGKKLTKKQVNSWLTHFITERKLDLIVSGTYVHPRPRNRWLLGSISFQTVSYSNTTVETDINTMVLYIPTQSWSFTPWEICLDDSLGGGRFVDLIPGQPQKTYTFLNRRLDRAVAYWNTNGTPRLLSRVADSRLDRYVAGMEAVAGARVLCGDYVRARRLYSKIRVILDGERQWWNDDSPAYYERIGWLLKTSGAKPKAAQSQLKAWAEQTIKKTGLQNVFEGAGWDLG